MPVTPITPAQIDEVGKGACLTAPDHSAKPEPEDGLGPTGECSSRGLSLAEVACRAWRAEKPRHFMNETARQKWAAVASAVVAAHEAEEARARPLSEWTEEDGNVLWWRFPIAEAPYCGSPLDVGRTCEITLRLVGEEHIRQTDIGGWPGYHTHWTRFDVPDEARALAGEAGTAETEGLGPKDDHAASSEATPSISPPPSPRKGQEENPCPMTVEEARDLLSGLDPRLSYAYHIHRLKEEAAASPYNWDRTARLKFASRIELALSTIRASEEDR